MTIGSEVARYMSCTQPEVRTTAIAPSTPAIGPAEAQSSEAASRSPSR